ncbi:MAG: HAMP domain-containing sensor histidine kinase [Clostridium sp.]
MRESLSKRLFLITLGLLLGLMALIMIFQTFMFTGFYEQKKIKSLSKSINKFSFLSSYDLNTDLKITSAFKEFEVNNSASIGLFTSNATLIRLPDRLKDYPEESEILVKFAKSLISNPEALDSILAKNETYSTTFDVKNTNQKRIGVATAMSLESHNDTIAIAVASAQPIQEAALVIHEMMIYIFVGTIFISIILSLIYSNLISKPLLSINRVANKMSKMEFDEKCIIDRDDEIGNLGNTLNFLSVNLQGALLDLQQKNKKLEEDIENERKVDSMRKDFIASVSHELKTPIGIIEGYAEGVKDGIVSGDDAIIYLETIIDESKKMSILVSNMLELSKLESGVIEPKFEVFNINRLINKLVNKHSLEASDKNLNLLFTPYTDFSYVNADIFQMEQVFTNLITNCLKYTPAFNDVVISVKEVSNKFVFEVLNGGAKIPEKDLEMLYNKFYRVDKSRTRTSNSTGLGLAIVRTILDIHKSEYSIKNTPEGVLFKFTLAKADHLIAEY